MSIFLMGSGEWGLEAGDWRLEAGDWRLGSRESGLENGERIADSWKSGLGTGEWRIGSR